MVVDGEMVVLVLVGTVVLVVLVVLLLLPSFGSGNTVVVVALIASRLSTVWVGGWGSGRMGAACQTPVIPNRHWCLQFV